MRKYSIDIEIVDCSTRASSSESNQEIIEIASSYYYFLGILFPFGNATHGVGGDC